MSVTLRVWQADGVDAPWWRDVCLAGKCSGSYSPRTVFRSILGTSELPETVHEIRLAVCASSGSAAQSCSYCRKLAESKGRFGSHRSLEVVRSGKHRPGPARAPTRRSPGVLPPRLSPTTPPRRQRPPGPRHRRDPLSEGTRSEEQGVTFTIHEVYYFISGIFFVRSGAPTKERGQVVNVRHVCK